MPPKTPLAVSAEQLPALLAPLIEHLTETITARVKAEIRAELSSVFSGSTGTAPVTPAPKTATKKAPAPKTAAPSNAALKVKAGKRRTEEEVEQAARVLGIWFKNHPGSRIDQAAAELQVPVKDLQLPIQYMLKKKTLTKKGKLRGTTYALKG